jgi:hypothetical protein
VSGRIQIIRIGDTVSKDIVISVCQENINATGFQECLKIQSDLNKLSEWCYINSLLLNVSKCKTISFARSRHPVKFLYMLGGTMLHRMSSINDLAVIMDEKMTFSDLS